MSSVNPLKVNNAETKHKALNAPQYIAATELRRFGCYLLFIQKKMSLSKV